MTLLLLLACATDVGTVTVTCTFEYTTAGVPETGEYPGYTATCDAWAEAGDQRFQGTVDTCEADGIAAGADVATCECTPDFGTCTFPNGTND